VYDVLEKEYTEFNSAGEIIKQNYRIHYSDTDSVVIELLNNEKIDKIKDHIHKTELGKFADEEPDHNIIGFIGLKSKMYDMLKQDKMTNRISEKKKAKGIKGTEMQFINYEIFKDVLLDKYIDREVNSDFNKKHTIRYNKLHSIKHEIFMSQFIKKGLSCFDDKRYILSDGIHTLPFGNYRINIIEKLDKINRRNNTNFTDLDVYNMKLKELKQIVRNARSTKSSARHTDL